MGTVERKLIQCCIDILIYFYITISMDVALHSSSGKDVRMFRHTASPNAIL